MGNNEDSKNEINHPQISILVGYEGFKGICGIEKQFLTSYLKKSLQTCLPYFFHGLIPTPPPIAPCTF